MGVGNRGIDSVQARLSSQLQISMGTDDGWEPAKEHQQGSSVDGYAVSSARDLVSEKMLTTGTIESDELGKRLIMTQIRAMFPCIFGLVHHDSGRPRDSIPSLPRVHMCGMERIDRQVDRQTGR